MLVYVGAAAQGKLGVVAEMQVMGVMLNRCDSVLERQTQPSLMLEEKAAKQSAAARYTPENTL